MKLQPGLTMLALAACGTTTPGTTVTGTNGFTPKATLMLQSAIGCSPSGMLSSGKLDALSAIVADADLQSPTCGTPPGAVPHVLVLEIATGGYFAADPNTANEPIVAGTSFSILDEGVTDEDLCGNVPTGMTQPTAIAMLEQCPAVDSCATSYWATSGSVTVTGVTATGVAGTFDLVFGDGSGSSDGGTLTGRFSADGCP